MQAWIAEFFEHGHSLSEIYDMGYWEYNDIVLSLANNRSGNKQTRNLRPVQKSAIEKAKQNKKK